MTWSLSALHRRITDGDRGGPDAGFTVLEVLVAFSLFVLVVATATYGIFQAINTAHSSQQRTDAAGVAQSYIAQAAANTATIGPESSKSYSAAVAGEQFTVLRTVTFSNSGNQCSRGASFTVDVVVKQAQTGKFLARSDSVIAC